METFASKRVFLKRGRQILHWRCLPFGWFGAGYDFGKIKLQDGTELGGGNAYSLYKSFGADYQLP
ncbi:hypothetical protein FXV77_05575 [Sphingobacterium phlebotomi]|uniref:Uncharacterized protein n=1 Tax=Sphingobacterium phlebotomi TaxID=2605433 RepID=A0A5D4HD55_9SPHI|nr:hypothetical protein [Sphingobacterium phlebotomi]TYR37475.1 hypothetical protein FXV77_05575 [Sphingobacterium phlebotomi]